MRDCGDNSPPWFTGRWRDWHRGHGCNKDDGKPRTPEGEAEIAARRGTEARATKTRLDLLLDRVRFGQSEITIDTDGYTPEQVVRIVSTAESRGLHAAYDGRHVLIRALVPTQ